MPKKFGDLIAYFSIRTITLIVLFQWTEMRSQVDNTYFILPEFASGMTSPANNRFPEVQPQKTFFFSIGNTNKKRTEEWLHRLNFPATGMTMGYTHFGNSKALGKAFTFMPFIEFDVFKKKYDGKLKLHMGIGASSFDVQYDEETNPFNRAITTKVSWAFRSFVYYKLLQKSSYNLRVGLGYYHNSNGHTKLPNQGLNSFLLSVSSRIFPYAEIEPSTINQDTTYDSTYQYYASIRTGIGLQVLTYDDEFFQAIEDYNEPKEVYSVAVGGGIVINKFLKLGGGFHYRFYEHYYDYIKRNKTEPYISNPYANATSYGIFFGGELLLSHVGLEFQMGINFYKPFYEEEWLLNEEELNWYYQIKKHVPARMGLKLYAINTDKSPKHNIFIGANINANLGQADFTELSLGYVRRFQLKKK